MTLHTKLSNTGRYLLAAMLTVFALSTSSTAVAQDSFGGGAGYKLGPEDVLDISVWKEEELSKQVVVRPDGGISFPLAGNVLVAGKTVDEVQALLTERIEKYVPGAVVSVSVIKVAAYKIYVMGKVNNPGEYVLGSYVSVVKALTLADGLTPYAKESSIKVIRTMPDGTEMTLPFNYSQVKAGKKLEQNITLKSGDVVLVP